MNPKEAEDHLVGTDIPSLTLPPINRTMLALFAGASHDHTPLHIDIDFVRASGGSDVFAHGMFIMANMARLVTRWRPQRDLVSLKGRFLDIVHIGDVLTCKAQIKDHSRETQGWQAVLEITVTDQTGRKVMSGAATVLTDSEEQQGV